MGFSLGYVLDCVCGALSMRVMVNLLVTQCDFVLDSELTYVV